MIGTYVHRMITNSPRLLQVYTVSIAMIGTYVHGMITNSPGLLQVYTVTIAMIGTYVQLTVRGCYRYILSLLQ